VDDVKDKDAKASDAAPWPDSLAAAEATLQDPVLTDGERATAPAETPASAEPDSGEEAVSEWAQLQDRYLRLLAEFDNYKKRTAREHQVRVQSAHADVLLELLDVVDNFDRALAVEHEDSTYAQGVALMYDQLQALLARRGVVAMASEREKFDPRLHEALLHLPSDLVPAGFVCRELRKGYSHHGRTLRPAQVAVSSGPGSGGTTGVESEDSKPQNEIESGVQDE
jgi:molecular chaperone GrpE